MAFENEHTLRTDSEPVTDNLRRFTANKSQQIAAMQESERNFRHAPGTVPFNNVDSINPSF